MAKHLVSCVVGELDRISRIVARIGATDDQTAEIVAAIERFRSGFTANSNVTVEHSAAQSEWHQSNKTPCETEQQKSGRHRSLFADAEIPERHKSESTDDAFKRFWGVYPRKCSKAKARIAFDKALKRLTANQSDEDALVTILSGAIIYAKRANPDAMCHPTTWLNGSRWEDDPDAIATPAFSDANKSRNPTVIDVETELEEARRMALGLPSMSGLDNVIAVIKKTWNPDTQNKNDVNSAIRQECKNEKFVNAAIILTIQTLFELESGTPEYTNAKAKFDYIVNGPKRKLQLGEFDESKPRFTLEESQRMMRL